VKALTSSFIQKLGVIIYLAADVLSSLRVLLSTTGRAVSKIDSAVFTVVFRHLFQSSFEIIILHNLINTLFFDFFFLVFRISRIFENYIYC